MEIVIAFVISFVAAVGIWVVAYELDQLVKLLRGPSTIEMPQPTTADHGSGQLKAPSDGESDEAGWSEVILPSGDEYLAKMHRPFRDDD